MVNKIKQKYAKIPMATTFHSKFFIFLEFKERAQAGNQNHYPTHALLIG
jgi:hypothetical protein